jgi:hypothetical protein
VRDRRMHTSCTTTNYAMEYLVILNRESLVEQVV